MVGNKMEEWPQIQEQAEGSPQAGPCPNTPSPKASGEIPKREHQSLPLPRAEGLGHEMQMSMGNGWAGCSPHRETNKWGS
jgi:hypothetical protein